MSSPWDLAKKRPATGLIPWSSKKPTSTGPSFIVCMEVRLTAMPRLKTTVLLDCMPSAMGEPQDTPFTPARRSTSWRKADRQGAPTWTTWLVSSFRALCSANSVCR